MISQEMVESHARRMAESSASFGQSVSAIADSVISGLQTHVSKSISHVDGVAEQSSDNARKILSLEDKFLSLLNSSDYYATVLAFVSDFVDQVDEFDTFYSGMREDLPLPDAALTESDKDILSNQVGVAVAIVGGHSEQVSANLRHLLVRSLGEFEVLDLAQGISETIRKITRVEQVAKDQLMLFYRLTSSLIYRGVESGGRTLRYAYVGPRNDRSRDFCKKLLSGRSYTSEEIAAMDNDQTVSTFDNCGGFGCCHWWKIAEVI